MKDRLLDLMEELYRRLDQALPKFEGDPCGSCRVCCTSEGLTQHSVTELELDYIEARVGPEKIEAFRRFTARDQGTEFCPYYERGCSIHTHRPFSCRVFGHHREEGTRLPEVCIFAGQEKVFDRGGYYEQVPLAADLRDLVRRYWPFRKPRPSVVAADCSLLAQGDPLERALFHQTRGELPLALEELQRVEEPLRETPYFLYCLSLVLEGLGLHQEAAQALGQLLKSAPDSHEAWYRLGCNRFASDDRAGAYTAFERTVEIYPQHPVAWGLMGCENLLQGDPETAAVHLERAVANSPENEIFRSRLAQCRPGDWQAPAANGDFRARDAS